MKRFGSKQLIPIAMALMGVVFAVVGFTQLGFWDKEPYCIKPIDAELIEKCAKETGAIVTAEEHSVIGGLGGAVSEVLAKSGCLVPVEMVGMQDRHGESGPYSELLKKYGLDADAVAAAAKKATARK